MKLFEAMVRKLLDVTRDDIESFVQTNRDPEFNYVDMDEFEDAIQRLQRATHGIIHGYRAITVFGSFEENLRKNNIDTARAYQDMHRGYGDTYILRTTIPASHVDWIKTVALNMVPIRGRYEQELRLFPGKIITLDDIIGVDGTPDIDPKDLEVKFFKT